MHMLRGIEFFLIQNDQFSSIILQNMILKRVEFQGHLSVMLIVQYQSCSFHGYIFVMQKLDYLINR